MECHRAGPPIGAPGPGLVLPDPPATFYLSQDNEPLLNSHGRDKTRGNGKPSLSACCGSTDHSLEELAFAHGEHRRVAWLSRIWSYLTSTRCGCMRVETD